MYNINIMTENPTLYQLKVESLQILFGKVAHIINWTTGSLKAAIWRCYCPLEPGGSVFYENHEYPLLPGKGYIIPELTDFKGRNTASFVKVFCHFHYNSPNRSYDKGIYSFDINGEIMQQLQRYMYPDANIDKLQRLMLFIISQGLAELPEDCIHFQEYDYRINLILAEMKAHIREGVSNSVLAKKVNLTEPSMIRLFRETIGESPQKYSNSIRLKHACNLLIHSTMSIDEIADECGYWDRNHFTRAFRKHWNYPPATYRRIQKLT